VSICLTSSIYHLPKEPKPQNPTTNPTTKQTHNKNNQHPKKKATNINHKPLNSAKVREKVQTNSNASWFPIAGVS
jgi:hypothetical protein